MVAGSYGTPSGCRADLFVTEDTGALVLLPQPSHRVWGRALVSDHRIGECMTPPQVCDRPNRGATMAYLTSPSRAGEDTVFP